MNAITRSKIDGLLAASEIDVCTKFDKVTVVTVKLPNGFVLVEASGAVDKANYSEEMGRKVCLERIAIKLWQFEGYVLSSLLSARIPDQARVLCYHIEGECESSEANTEASILAANLNEAIARL